MSERSEEVTGRDAKWQVYSVGLIYLSICTDLPRDEIEARANLEHPTGIASRWTVADESFRTGEANPHPCEQDETRSHWLLTC